MTKNLNIRLEDEIFDTFTQYCESNRYSKTEILKDYIQRLINGELQPFCNDGNDSVMIPPTQKLDEAIANHPKLKTLEDRLEGLIELVESRLGNDDVTQGNATMNNDSVMTSNDVSLQNKPSEDSLEGGLNENQVLEVIERETPIKEAITEDLPEATRGDIPEPTDIQGIQDKGVDEVEQAIAKLRKLTARELKELVSIINGKKSKTITNYRGNKDDHLKAILESLKGEGKELILEALN